MTISRQSETESMLLVRDAARALGRSLSVRLAEHDVSFGHWSFLRVLWVEDGLTQRELSECIGVMEPTTSSAIKTIERLDYVVRRQHEGDWKKVYIHPTPKGRLLEKRLVPLAEEANRISAEVVAPEHVAITRAALRHDRESRPRREPFGKTDAVDAGDRKSCQ